MKNKKLAIKICHTKDKTVKFIINRFTIKIKILFSDATPTIGIVWLTPAPCGLAKKEVKRLMHMTTYEVFIAAINALTIMSYSPSIIRELEADMRRGYNE